MEHRKLALKLEDLDVTSFEPAANDAGRGTVQGNDSEQTAWPRTCASQCWSMCLADSDCCSEWPGDCTTNC